MSSLEEFLECNVPLPRVTNGFLFLKSIEFLKLLPIDCPSYVLTFYYNPWLFCSLSFRFDSSLSKISESFRSLASSLRTPKEVFLVSVCAFEFYNFFVSAVDVFKTGEADFYANILVGLGLGDPDFLDETEIDLLKNGFKVLLAENLLAKASSSEPIYPCDLLS